MKIFKKVFNVIRITFYIVLFLIFLLTLFLFFNHRAHAQTATEIFPTINSNGTVVLSTLPTSGCLGMNGRAVMYYGTYPSQAQNIFQDSATSGEDDCQVYLANYNSSGALDFEDGGFFFGDGDYWIFLGGNNLDNDWTYYIRATRTGGIWTPAIPPDTTTRIINAYYATSTQNYILEVFLDPSRAFPRIEWVLQHPLLGQTSSQTIVATSTGAITYEIPVLVSTFATSTDGWSYQATTEILSYESCTGDPWFGTEELVCSDPNEPLLAATTTRFFVNSTDEEIDLWESYQRANLIATTTCSITSIDGCFRNAFIWAFVPDEQTYRDFENFKDKLTTKAPIGYFFQTTTMLKGISSESENEFTFNIPTEISTYVFTPIRILIASVLWIFFSVHIYKRLKKLEL